jgi:ectoine hydroxylase-related dioxygenase (phytanoyl-CoA dioxygenase family)
MGMSVEDHVREIDEQGVTCLRGVLDPDQVATLLEDLERIERQEQVRPATNDFEGTNTLRAYNLLRHGPLWEAVPVHPAVLPVVEGVLDRGCLVSSLSSIRIRPGETAQPLHADDQLIPLTPPHPPVVCNTMWALTDFTPDNGATRIVPGSHRWGKPEYGGGHPTEPAVMAAGDVLVWNGSLWHAGGANTTDADRVGIAMNYCAGWVRQQENQQLGLSPERVARFEPRLQELVGYSVYHGLIGHIERRSPAELLLTAGEPSRPTDAAEQDRSTMVWDRV